MSREMKHSGIEWIGEIPKDWNCQRLKFLCLIQTGNQDTQDANPEGEYPFYVRSPLIERSSKYSFDGEGILMAGDGVGAGRVFHHAFGKYAVHQRVYRLSSFTNIFPNYLFYYISNLFNRVMDMGSAQSTVPSVRLPMLSNFTICIPFNSEQQKIANYLDKVCGEVDELVSLQEKMIEELKAYKQSVITEAVTKGLNPNVPMKDSGIDWIGEIPEHWEVCRFKDVATVKANLVHPNDYLDYPQIAPDNIEKGSARLLPYKSVKDSNVISDNHLFYKGQIIYSKIRPVLNKLIIAPFDGLCSADMYPIETSNNKNFQKYYMLSKAFVSQVALVVQDRVKMPKINQNELGVIYVLSLPSDEQQSIASYLDTKCAEIDALIAIKQAKIDELKEYKKSVIYEYVTGKKEVGEDLG